VPHAGRRVEDQGLSSGRLAPPLFREGDGSGVARSDRGPAEAAGSYYERTKMKNILALTGGGDSDKAVFAT
jgi:hypothetical protein